MKRVIRLAAAGHLIALSLAGAQNPQRHFTEGIEARFSSAEPQLHYTLEIRDGDTTGFDVAVRIRHAPDTLRLAMAKHPEYDDRYFRFVVDVRAEGTGASIVREDSTVWRLIARGGDATVSYRIQLPPAPPGRRAAWLPFLSPTGGLTGGAHAFMYAVGAELAPAHVTLRLPTGWSVATGLTPTADPRTFFASNADVLVESPILVGPLRRHVFAVDGVPHEIAHWIAPGGPQFDTTAFDDGVERMTAEVVRLFGRPAYREYVFQLQDNAYGGLEHPNSVSLGVPSADLARSPAASLPEIAHEYIHTWNLLRIRPVEYVGVTYHAIEPVPTLWFSEGLTMMYADIALRRAKLPASDSTRIAHLERLIASYSANSSNSRFSAEAVSRVAYNARPDALGDYGASTHLQGELLGTVLDLVVRDATNGRRSMDDVMRLMLDRFGGSRGFTGSDVESAVGDVCHCSVRALFDAHVRGARPIPFDTYLGVIGLRTRMTWEPARRDGSPDLDFRIRAWNAPNDSLISLVLFNPASVWGRAGLHSRDRVFSVNGQQPKTWPDLRQLIARSRIGDTLTLVVQAPRAPPRTVRVVMSGYERPIVRIEPLPGATEKQLRLRDAWLRAAP